MLRLDINLVFTIINLLILYFLMRKFLFKPVNGIIAKREELIQSQLAEAEEAKMQAAKMKEDYEASIKDAKDEADQIVSAAREKAKTEYDRIVKSADADVAKKLQKAEETIAEERAKSLRSMEKEIETLVMAAATKVVGEKVTAENSQNFYDEFIAEMGEKN